ncbi:hypothetical protein [Flagellimonas sp. S3867]|uniref:hypothetical protein n=1 Tax=Flagellimonas sp. S3867 TaxID=2768063 RepID=UPI0016851C97|nr:hypothetical protein [Flagellimonas sp. S3867]
MKKRIRQKEPKKTLVCLLTMLFTIVSYTQQSSFDLPNYHPVSPNAASLGSFGLYPVNKNLGTASVNVPIYTLSEKGLSVPISISYNTSGVRLNDLASWVGLGWSLNAGGAIVRNTKGLPDLAYDRTILDIENATFSQTNWDYMYGVTLGTKDTAPDAYVLNALGRSATFYFDQDQNFKAVFEDGSPIAIKVISVDEIHAVLEDGTTLIFGKGSDGSIATEVTDSNLNDPFYTLNFISAWYLTEVISKDGEHTISFRYKSGTGGDEYALAATESIVLGTPGITTSNATANLSTGNYEYSTISKKYLDEITFSNGYIKFESTLNRNDLIDDYQLDAIKVYMDDGSPSGTMIDEYHFTYGEFTRSGGVFSKDYDHSGSQFNTTRQKNSREKSLKLLSMYRGPSASTGEVHSFEYNSTLLPKRGTTAMDSWGHPNNNTGTLLPETTTTVEAINIVTYTLGNGNREVNESKMKAAVLEKITYPTGGHTIFEHEANRLLTTDPVWDTKTKVARAFGTECTDPAYPHYDEEVNFNIPSNATNIKMTLFLSPVTSQGSNQSYVSIDGYQYYRPTPDSNGGGSDSSDGYSETIGLVFGQDLDPDPFVANIFNPGLHTIKANDTGYGPFGAYGCSTLSITLTWDEPNGTQQVEKLIGGLRIKSITNYDGTASTPVSVKKYEYAQPNLIQPIRNRGYVRKFFSITDFILKTRVSSSPHFNNNLGGEPAIEYGTVTEYDEDPVTLEKKGKMVSYFDNVTNTRVLSSVVPASPFKHTSFNYNFNYAGPNNDLGDLFVRPLIYKALDGLEEFSFYKTNKWKRGKLLKEETYKTENGSDILLSKVENEYETIAPLTIPNNFIFSTGVNSNQTVWSVTDNPYDQNFDFCSLQFCYQIGDVEMGRRTLKKTINTQYDDSGLNPVVTTTDYFYENLTHMQVTKTETTESSGNTVTVKTYYPDDIQSTSGLGEPFLSIPELDAIQRLRRYDSNNATRLNRVTEPIQTETTIKNSGGTVLAESRVRTNYREWTTDLVMPEFVKSLKGTYNVSTNTEEDRIIYKAYDDHGNVLEASKANGPPISYIWGYNKMYPVAKVENATRSQIEALSEFSTGFHAGDGNLTTAEENALRGLSGALITTYSYDPLVGVTSITDPSGYTINYVYDSNNRLKEIRDEDNNLVTDYQYHYEGQ